MAEVLIAPWPIEPPKFVPGGDFGARAIELTVSLRESHNQSADISDAPIEDGSNISDHRRIGAPMLSMDGCISEASTASTAEIDSNGNVRQRVAPDVESIQESYKRLIELFEQDALFQVVTSLRLYDNMHFTRLTVNRDKSTDGVLSFSAEMRQVEIVTSATARVSAEDKPKAQETKKKGRQEKEHPDPHGDSNSSLMHDLQDAVKGLF